MKIDKVLEQNGWERQGDFKYYSSITKDVTCLWVKNGKKVRTGLSVKGYPPTLVYPIPSVVHKETNDYNKAERDKGTFNYLPHEAFTIRWIDRSTEQEIKEWLDSL